MSNDRVRASLVPTEAEADRQKAAKLATKASRRPENQGWNLARFNRSVDLTPPPVQPPVAPQANIQVRDTPPEGICELANALDTRLQDLQRQGLTPGDRRRVSLHPNVVEREIAKELNK